MLSETIQHRFEKLINIDFNVFIALCSTSLVSTAMVYFFNYENIKWFSNS